MPRHLAPDEQAVEVASLADYGERAADELASYDAVENRGHVALLGHVDAEGERIVRALIRGDMEVERPKITRNRYISHAIGQQARRLAGFFSGVGR